MKKLGWITVVVLIGLAGWMGWSRRQATGSENGFKTETVKRGDLENLVSSTGTLSAIGTVEVGTQVSGTIDRVLVDFNDPVKKGQLVAVLDKRVLKSAVKDAEASLIRAKAQLELALADLKRSEKLYKDEMISEQAYTEARTAADTARASVISAETALERARANLNYADIRSPIDGTVIARNVEPGQTVAASFSTPTLFLIAADLSRMEIQALVDESDIGQIKEDMTVRFRVEAYPDRVFTGKVRQIRLQPSTVNNVVNYTVIVDADNPEGLLLPGMTATVDFVAQHLENVLLVPNAALRFKADDAMMTAFRERMKKRFAGRMKEMTEEERNRMRGRFSGQQRTGDASNQRNVKTVWILDESDQPVMARFEGGATDGKYTVVKRSRMIKEGTKVIIARNQPNGQGNSPTPFQRRLF